MKARGRLLGRMSATSALSALGAFFCACHTREDAARAAAREAALVAISACRDAGDDDSCREAICRDRCASFADSTSFAELCMTKCTSRGTCDSDRDCDRGLVCVMFAPRVRRCAPPPAPTP